MRLLKLLLGAAAAAALDTGLEEFQLCCGNDCVRSGDAGERGAWAARDKGRRVVQTMPRTYRWADIKPISREKSRLSAGIAVRHKGSGMQGTVQRDHRDYRGWPGGSRLDVLWTGMLP